MLLVTLLLLLLDKIWRRCHRSISLFFYLCFFFSPLHCHRFTFLTSFHFSFSKKILRTLFDFFFLTNQKEILKLIFNYLHFWCIKKSERCKSFSKNIKKNWTNFFFPSSSSSSLSSYCWFFFLVTFWRYERWSGKKIQTWYNIWHKIVLTFLTVQFVRLK